MCNEVHRSKGVSGDIMVHDEITLRKDKEIKVYVVMRGIALYARQSCLAGTSGEKENPRERRRKARFLSDN